MAELGVFEIPFCVAPSKMASIEEVYIGYRPLADRDKLRFRPLVVRGLSALFVSGEPVLRQVLLRGVPQMPAKGQSCISLRALDEYVPVEYGRWDPGPPFPTAERFTVGVAIENVHVDQLAIGILMFAGDGEWP